MKEARCLVVGNAVFFENIESRVLCILLGIELSESQAFGSTSKALSFNNKLTLLTDIKVMDKDERTKFIKFAEIRNQFAHNINVHDFTSCFKVLKKDNNNVENFLKNKYKTKFSNKNENSELYRLRLFNELFHDLLGITGKLVQACDKKSSERSANNIREKLLNSIIEELEKHENDTC